MAVRGENIGTAYVRILADGAGLNKSIRDAIDDDSVFEEFDRNGRATSAAWQEAFEAEMAKKPSQSALQDAIAGPLARGNWLSTKFFRSKNWRDFRADMKDEFGESGEDAVESLERGLLSGRIDFDALNKRLDNMMPLITQARIDANRKMLQQAYDMNAEFDRKNRRLVEEAYRMNAEFTRKQGRLVQEAYRLNAEYDRREKRLLDEADADFDRHVKDRQRAVDDLRDSYGDLLLSVNRLAKGERGIHRRDIIRSITDLRTEMDKAGGSTDEWEFNLRALERRLIDIHPRTDRATRSIGNFADGVGRLTGRGSRNDFLNFFGSVNRGFVNMFSVLPRGIGMFQRLLGVFGEARALSMAGGRGGFLSFLSGAGAVAMSAGKGLLAFGAAAVVLVTLLGPAVALLSSLLAILTALVSTIGFALVGALAAATGLLVTFGAAAGIAALGFASLDDAQKKVLKNNFKPVISQFRELGDIAASRMFRDLEGLGDNIASGLERLEPVVRKTSDAIRDVGLSFGQSLQSRGYRLFVNSLENFLPDATRRLGDIVGQTLGGFGGIFRGMIPFLEDTLEWLDKITGRFSKWANSVEGQTAIRDFFEDVQESAKSFGDFLGEIGELLGEVLNQGKGTGDSLFQSMADNIQKFTEYLQKNPDALKNWFSDAKDIAEDLGDLFVAVGKVVDALDSPEARRAVRFFIKIAEAIAFVVPHIPSIERMSDALSKMFGAMDEGGGSGPMRAMNAFGGFIKIVTMANPLFAAIADNIGRLWDAFRGSRIVRGVVNMFQRLPGQVRGALSGLPGRVRAIFERLPDPVQRVVTRIANFFRRLPGQVRAAVSSIPGRFRNAIDGLPGQAQRIINRVTTFFRSLPNRIRSGISSIPSRFRGVIDGLPGIAQGILNRVTAFFRSLPGRIRGGISAIPSIFRNAIDGLPGNAQSIVNRVATFFRNLPSNIRNAISSIPGIVESTFNRIVTAISHIPGDIVALFSGLGSRIASAIGSINIPRPNIPDIPGIPDPFASGGLILSRTYAMMGEDGAEAVVPLNRPLSQVDPSVRWLSAIAQGLSPLPGSGKTIDVGGITVVSPNADPHAVALETINAVMATGY